MTDTIRKRRENGRRYGAALASWNALDAGKPCRVCRSTGTIQYEDGELPCPYCRPNGAREAARGATP